MKTLSLKNFHNKAIQITITLLLIVIVLPLDAQRKTGNPLDNLPSNIQILTHFGERADISPDNQSVAFMTKSFGDAMVIDLETRNIKCDKKTMILLLNVH